MCGHLGVILKGYSGFSNNEWEVFANMLYMDALRGWDATGVCMVDNDKEITVLKDAIPPWEFIPHNEFNLLKNKTLKNGRVLLGHNRKKTVGGSKAEHAHPFVVHDNKVFFHNGTLLHHEKLYKTDVDSEALGLHLTNLNGDKEAIEEALGKVNGAYACVWYDQKLNKVFFLRNKERSLYYARTGGGNLVYGSEHGLIYSAVYRNGASIDKDGILPFKEHHLYSIDCAVYDPKLEVEELKVKPFFTPPLPTKTGETNYTVIGESDLTKNTYKKLIKSVMGRETFFRINNVIREGNTKNFLIEGENLYDFGKHLQFTGVYESFQDISTLKNILIGKMCRGLPFHSTYDKDKKVGIVHLSNLNFTTPVVALLTNEAKTNLH